MKRVYLMGCIIYFIHHAANNNISQVDTNKLAVHGLADVSILLNLLSSDASKDEHSKVHV